MDRLTTRSSLCDRCPKEDWCHQDCFESQLYERLAHYEDLEEQGRLVELKHGTWEMVEGWDGDCMWRCSVCKDERYFETGTPFENHVQYCPNCGAKQAEKGGAE